MVNKKKREDFPSEQRRSHNDQGNYSRRLLRFLSRVKNRLKDVEPVCEQSNLTQLFNGEKKPLNIRRNGFVSKRSFREKGKILEDL
jgi:hypothetical protein